jgi:short-subunit dehydrogenase
MKKKSKKEYILNRVIITGASSGIGRAIANRMVDSGYDVIGIARNSDIKSTFEIIKCDLRDVSQIQKVSKEILKNS